MDSFFEKEAESRLFVVGFSVVVAILWALVSCFSVCFDVCTQGEQSDKEEKNFFHCVMNYWLEYKDKTKKINHQIFSGLFLIFF